MRRSKRPQKCKQIKKANKKTTTASKSCVTKTSKNDSKSEVHQNGSTELTICQAETEKIDDTVSNSSLISARNTRRSNRIGNNVSKATEQKRIDVTDLSICPVERKGSHDTVFTSILISELQNNSKHCTRNNRQSKINWNSVSESRVIEQNQNDSTVFSKCQMKSKESHVTASESNLNKELHSDSKAQHTNLPKREGTVCEFVVKLEKEYLSLMQHHEKGCSLCSKIILQTQENQLSVTESRMCGRDLEIRNLESNFKGDMVNSATLTNPHLPSQELVTKTGLKVHAKHEPTPVHEKYEQSVVENEPIPVYAKYKQFPVEDEPSIVYAEHEPSPVHAKYKPTPPVHANYNPTPTIHAKYEPVHPVNAKYEPAPPVYANYKPNPVYAKYELVHPVNAKYELVHPVNAKYEPAPPVHANYKPNPVYAKCEPVHPVNAKYEPAPVRAKHQLMAMCQQTNTRYLTQIATPRHFPKYSDSTQYTATGKLNVTEPLGVDENPSGVTRNDVQIVGITQPKYIIAARNQKNEGARNQGNLKDISKAVQYETTAIGLNKQDSRNSLIDHFIDVSVNLPKKKPTTTNFVSSQGVHSTECRLPAQLTHQLSDLQLNKSGGNAMLNAGSKFNPKPHVYKPTPLRFLPNLGNMSTANNVKVSGPHPPGYIPSITYISDELEHPVNEKANIPSQTDAKCSQEDFITSSNLPNLFPLQSQAIPIIVSDVEVSKRVSETVKSNLNPLRRSGRKRKVPQCEEQYESDLETDGSKNTDGECTDSDSSWELETHPRRKETHSKTHKLSKQMKPFVGPKNSTEVDVNVKGNFKCWLCKTTRVFCLNTKYHIIKKHGEGLCSFELNQTQLIGKMHILLYCPRSCQYATYDIDELKKHTASCYKPLLSVKGIKYLDLNNYFIQHIYPELINTEPQALFKTSKTKTRNGSYELAKQQITTSNICVSPQ